MTDLEGEMPSTRWKMPAALVVAALSVTALSGCETNLRKNLGLVGQGPDETMVVVSEPLQMPLSMPATTDELPTPQPGAPSLVEPQPLRDAERMLTGAVQSGEANQTSSEQRLLAKLGAEQADAEVRDRMADDLEEAASESRILDGMFGRDEATEGALLDPDEEARRLSEQAKQTKNPDLELLPPPDEDS